MAFIDDQLKDFKLLIENSIVTGGAKGKESMIRSSAPINLIHDAVKYDFILNGLNKKNIFPPYQQSKPELKLAGFLKQKDQDVCVTPSNVKRNTTTISWGPLAFEKKQDPFGYDYSRNTLVVNVRSQMSSIAKNSDTLFERTFAEALNLHMRYSDIVLGEVYLIPTHEYDDDLVKQKKIGFKKEHIDIEKYISFFSSINARAINGPDYAYERCALLIVDFNRAQPHLYKDSAELKKDKLISNGFQIEYADINYQNFTKDILSVYAQRFNISNLK